MTPEERALVDGARKRAGKAEDGPWRVEIYDGSRFSVRCKTHTAPWYSPYRNSYIPGTTQYETLCWDIRKDKYGEGANAEFIAHARSDVPALCDLADRQEAELAAKDVRIAELEHALASGSELASGPLGARVRELEAQLATHPVMPSDDEWTKRCSNLETIGRGEHPEEHVVSRAHEIVSKMDRMPTTWLMRQLYVLSKAYLMKHDPRNAGTRMGASTE